MHVMRLISRLKQLVPSKAKDYYHLLRYHMSYDANHRKILKEVRKNEHVRVAFIVMNISMWKNNALVECLLKDPRFEVLIVPSPAANFSRAQQEDDLQKMNSFFIDCKMPLANTTIDEPYDLRRMFNPHIIFYPQSYENIHCKEHDYTSFHDKLTCYIPYSFWPGAEPWGFDLTFHRQAWKIFYANTALKNYAKSVSLIKARNSIITGYPSTDRFLVPSRTCPWKNSDSSIKRIIWAPHFSVDPGTAIFSHSSFLMMAEGMVEIAKKYAGQIQIAFKPHPRLKTELYKLADWGKEKTDRYYSLWSTMINTQLETGEYIDLFMTSDALIHESGSFMVEYQYTKKPCLYVIGDYKQYYDHLNELGQRALACHDHTTDMNGIESFIRDIVIEGKDTKYEIRSKFFDEMLLPPNGKTVAQNIYEDLRNSLFNR